jgi:hypothetical protein
MSKPLLILIAFLAGLSVFLVYPAMHLQAVTAFREVVGECRKRTGFSDATCTTLVRKRLSIESCRKYTDFSDEECAKKIEEIKRDPEYAPQGSAGTNPASITQPAAKPAVTKELSPIAARSNDTPAGLQEKKERDIIALVERSEAMVSFLREKSIDMQTIEAQLPESRRKAAVLVSAYATYREVYEGTSKDTPSVKRSLREGARNAVIRAVHDFSDHYRTSIFVPLQTAYEKAL